MANITQPPHNLEAERYVLGAILIDPDAMMWAQEVDLKAGDFYHKGLGLIYEAAHTLAARWEPISVLSVAQVLMATKRINEAGGQRTLDELANACVSSAHTRYYAELIIRLSRQRRIILAAGRIAAAAQEHDGPVDGLYNETSKLFFEAVDTTAGHSHFYGSDDTLMAYLETQQKRQEALANQPELLAVTGLPDLDRLIDDIMPASLFVYVARPGVGKTMAMECAAEINARRGKAVAFYHLELTTQFMLDRRMVRVSNIPYDKIKRGYSGPEVNQATDQMRSWQRNITYIHCPGWTAARVAADMVRLNAQGKCDLAVVDYLQKLALPERKSWNPAMLYGAMAETLKNTAEQLEVPIILGSQVSRDFKGRDDQRPRAEDIRNSGEIEEKANQIVVLHRPVARDKQESIISEPIEAYVEKNTGGPCGKVNLLHMLGRFLLVCNANQKS